VVKAPDDYEQIKEKLRITSKNLDSLNKKLARKEELLSSFDSEQKQVKGLQKVNEGMKYIEEAYILLKDQDLSEGVQEIIENGLQSLNRLFHNLFQGQSK
jgi:Tfp pilus assembly protein PilO